MSWTLCTSGAAVTKAGKNANSDVVVSGVQLNEFSDQVEGTINTVTRRDWTTDYSTVGANFQGILEDTASDMITMKIITADMSGFSKTLNATTMLDILNDNSKRNIEILKLKENTEKMT